MPKALIMPLEIVQADHKIWNALFEEAGTQFRVADISEVLYAFDSGFDQTLISYRGDFVLVGGGVVRLQGKFSPTWDSAMGATIEAIRYN